MWQARVHLCKEQPHCFARCLSCSAAPAVVQGRPNCSEFPPALGVAGPCGVHRVSCWRRSSSHISCGHRPTELQTLDLEKPSNSSESSPLSADTVAQPLHPVTDWPQHLRRERAHHLPREARRPQGPDSPCVVPSLPSQTLRGVQAPSPVCRCRAAFRKVSLPLTSPDSSTPSLLGRDQRRVPHRRPGAQRTDQRRLEATHFQFSSAQSLSCV